MRVRFNEVFQVNGDGSISAKVPVVIGGVQVNPGVEFGRRVRLGNVHFAAVAGRDLDVEQQSGLTYLLRPYVPPTHDRGAAPPRMPSAMTREPMPLEATP